MSNTAPPSLFDRFEMAIHGLKRSVADAFPLRTMPGMLIHMIFNRFARLNLEVQKLAAEIRAGKIRPELAPRMRAAREPAKPTDPAAAPKLRIPQDFGWLIKRIPYVAAGHAEYFRKLLSEPEMVGMIAVSGRMRGLLRPLCRALMIEPSYLEPRIPAAGVWEESPATLREVRGGGEPPLQEESCSQSQSSPKEADDSDCGSLGNYNSLDAPFLRIAAFHGGGSPAADARPDDAPDAQLGGSPAGEILTRA